MSLSANGDLKSRVTVVGSGNWGSVAAKLIASNALKLPSFHDEVRMWVFEEVLPNGEKLTDVINKTNVKNDVIDQELQKQLYAAGKNFLANFAHLMEQNLSIMRFTNV